MIRAISQSQCRICFVFFLAPCLALAWIIPHQGPGSGRWMSHRNFPGGIWCVSGEEKIFYYRMLLFDYLFIVAQLITFRIVCFAYALIKPKKGNKESRWVLPPAAFTQQYRTIIKPDLLVLPLWQGVQDLCCPCCRELLECRQTVTKICHNSISIMLLKLFLIEFFFVSWHLGLGRSEAWEEYIVRCYLSFLGWWCWP